MNLKKTKVTRSKLEYLLKITLKIANVMVIETSCVTYPCKCVRSDSGSTFRLNSEHDLCWS